MTDQQRKRKKALDFFRCLCYTKHVRGTGEEQKVEVQTMSKKNSKKQIKTNVEIYQTMRRDWNGLNPITKVIPDKRNRKPKHKNRAYDD